MKNYQKICLISLLTVFLTLTLASFSFAQEKELEITYPTVPGAQTPTQIKTPLPQYVNYIFNFSIWIAGFVAFGAVLYGGVRYLTSAGDPTATADAREQIFAGILGLIIILSAYTILVNINPQLVVLRVDIEGAPAAGEIPGVYLCKTAELSAENCIVYTMTSDTIDPNFDDNFTNVFLKNTDAAVYGVVLHEDKGRRGSCEVHTSNSSVGIKASSITVFKQGGITGEGVSLYEQKEYNQRCSPGECNRWPASGGYQNVWKYNIDEKGRSIKVDPERNYLAALFGGLNGTGRCEVFTQSDPDLAANYIGVCGLWSNLGCFGSITVLPIK